MDQGTLKRSAQIVAMLLLLLAPLSAAAQISGDLVEPNVMLLLDSSAGMDFLRETGQRPDGMSQWGWSERVCRDQATSADPLTGWQKIQESMLGNTGSNGRCTVEPYLLRPSLYGLDRAEWEGAALLNADGFGTIENLKEFRASTRNHFSRVGCTGDYWHYNTTADMYQCIKLPGDPGYVAASGDPAYVAGVDGATTTVAFVYKGQTSQSYCREDDADAINGLCWNYHPAAEPRLSNGILDRYEGLARFGAMSMDGHPRCDTGTLAAPCDPHLTQWDYGDSRVWSGSGFGYFNSGGRGDDAGAIGGLVRLGDDSNAGVRSVLLTMEPSTCSEVAGMVDDAGYYFATDPGVLPSGYTITKQDPRMPLVTEGTDKYYRCRPKIAMLITDGDVAEFESVAGACTTTNTDADWDPLNPSMAIATTSFDCPRRASPEEAWELFDVGQRLLSGHVTGLGDTVSVEDQPLYLVVVGFNVPESCEDVEIDPTCNPMDADCQNRKARCVDCACDPTAILDPVAKALCETKREKCLAYTDGYNAKRCYVDACPMGETCLMSPREFLNETACQGWPWNIPAAGGAGGHTTSVPPPWLDPALPGADQICEDPSLANPTPICTLTQGNTANDRGDRALFITQSSDLAKALDLILGSLSSAVATRTDVVTWNVPVESAAYAWAGTNEIQRQYEFNSGYVGQPGKPWRGALKRTSYKCDGDVVAQPDAVANINEQLANQATRRIFTTENGSLAPADYAQPENTPSGTAQWVSGVGNLQPLVPLDDRALNDCDFTDGDVAGLCNTDTDTDADHPIQEAVADYTAQRGLADIYSSTPAVLGPPADELPNPSYEGYRAASASRHPFLFVSTNDGLLHAFDITAMKEGLNPAGNVESWAFVPRAVLSQLWQQYPINVTVNGATYSVEQGTTGGLYQHLFLGDGAPLAVDALLYQDPSTADPITTKDYWRAIVLSGLGKGVRGYYALDVTEAMVNEDGPSSTRLLRWEIAPDARMWGNNDVTAQAQLSKMGRTVSRPALGYVHYTPPASGATGQYAVAILPGGYNPDPSPAGNTGVYIVRLGDGKLIRYLEPGVTGSDDMCPGTPGLKEESGVLVESAQLLGEPSVPFGARQATVSTSAFIGDDRGRLWKIHMADADPKEWCLELFFDTLVAWDYPYDDCTAGCTPASTCHHIDCCVGSAAGKPCASDSNAPRNMDAPRITLLGAPTIAQNDEGKNVIVFGVGSMDSLATWNRSRVFSITEGGFADIQDTDLGDTDSGEITGHSTKVNWWIGDPLTAEPLADGDWSAWHTTLRTKMSGVHVNQTYTGLNGESFFNVGEKLVGRPVVFNKVAYFTTFLPVSDPTVDDACESGGSRIWGVDYEDRAGENGVIEATYATDDFGKMGDDVNAAMFVETPYHGALLSGVKVVARPRCSAGLDYDVYELTAQKANPAYQQGQSNTVSASAVTSVTQQLGSGATPMSRVVRFDSWSIVFE